MSVFNLSDILGSPPRITELANEDERVLLNRANFNYVRALWEPSSHEDNEAEQAQILINGLYEITQVGPFVTGSALTTLIGEHLHDTVTKAVTDLIMLGVTRAMALGTFTRARVEYDSAHAAAEEAIRTRIRAEDSLADLKSGKAL